MIRLAIFVFLIIVVYKLLSGLIKGVIVSNGQEVPANKSWSKTRNAAPTFSQPREWTLD